MFVGALIAATALFTFGGVPATAQAASVSDFDQLALALNPGIDSTITLTGDAWGFGKNLVVDRDVTIDLGGHVLAADNFTVSSGKTLTFEGASDVRPGKIFIDGTLRLGSDLKMATHTQATVGIGGSITSDGGPFTVSGAQTITNNGTITAKVDPAQAVTGNNFTLRFRGNTPAGQSQDVTVFAPSLDAAGVALPDFTRVHASISEWNSETDGSGDAVTTATKLALVPYWNTFHAQWVASGITSIGLTYEGSPAAAEAGDTRVTATDTSPGGGNADISDLVDFSSDNPDDELNGGGFEAYLVSRIAGTRLVTAALRTDPSVSVGLSIEVSHSPYPATISLAVTPSSVALGAKGKAKATAVLSATDGYGNAFGYNLIGGGECRDCGLRVTSSVPGDVIDPETGVITFSSVGSRTITATVQQVESEPLLATAVVAIAKAVLPPVKPPTKPPVTPPTTKPPVTPPTTKPPVTPPTTKPPVTPPVTPPTTQPPVSTPTPTPTTAPPLAATGASPTPTAGIALLALLGGLGTLLLAAWLRRRA